jgi:hypothetical protein
MYSIQIRARAGPEIDNSREWGLSYNVRRTHVQCYSTTEQTSLREYKKHPTRRALIIYQRLISQEYRQ